MNSIQFITNHVGRVIGTPSHTPRRSPSSSSLYSPTSSKTATDHTDARSDTPDVKGDLDQVSNRLIEELNIHPARYPDNPFQPDVESTEGFGPSDETHLDDVKPARKENTFKYILLFIPRLLVWIVTAPFLWLATFFQSSPKLPDDTITNDDRTAYGSIFSPIIRIFSWSSAPKQTQQAFNSNEKQSLYQHGLSEILESPSTSDPGSVISRNLRSPYTSLRIPNASINNQPSTTASGTPKSKPRRAPISYALKYPRSYAPPRPLLFNPSPTAPISTPREKKILVLDLDETLIHSMFRSVSGFPQGHMIEVKLQNSQFATLYNVLKRPYCDEFLEAVSQWYTLVIFTASVQAYADPMIDWLEKDRKYFHQRLYRQHCTFHASLANSPAAPAPMEPGTNRPAEAVPENFGYVKDLSKVNADLSKILIVDNSPVSFMNYESNAIEIDTWINDPSDTGLLSLIPMLSALRFTTDVRTILSLKSGESMFN